MNLKLWLLAGLWIAWCTLHSLMISSRAVNALRKNLGDYYRFYRIVFNLVAVITLAPILIFSNSIRGHYLFSWSGAWRPVQLLLALGALVLFYAGGRHYDLWQFLGVRQVVKHEVLKGLTETGYLDTTGILGSIRHPWYAAGILIIWARPWNTVVLVTNAVLTTYLIVGAVLEEKKLVEAFGEEYRRYQRKVPMFFPKLGRKSSEV